MGNILNKTALWLRSLTGMIYPDTCIVCRTSLNPDERYICLSCRVNFPRTNLHREPFSVLHQHIAMPAPVEKAAAYFYYIRGNAYTRLIQVAKYNSRPDIARWLAEKFAEELKADNFFDGIDAIIPVPMHKWKKLKRGYNQADEIAGAISSATGLPVLRTLVAMRSHTTQTHLGAEKRLRNIQGVYTAIRPDKMKGKHVLIVDDVITTGATMSACCSAIHSASPDTRISVLALGATRLQ